MDLLVCGSLDSFLADIESEVYDSSCLNAWASKPWSEHPWPVGWPTIAQSARCLSTKPVSMEETSSFSSLRIVRDRAHSLPGWNFQYPHIAGIITALLQDQTIDPPFLPYDCRHSKHTGTGPRHHTPSKHSMRGRACSYPPVEKAPERDRLHLG